MKARLVLAIRFAVAILPLIAAGCSTPQEPDLVRLYAPVAQRPFPLDILKIDRSFVRDLDTGAGDATIVAAIIAMGNSLKLKVIAEGVETVRQKDALSALGCHRMQGYLFSPPVAAQQIPAMVEKLVLSHSD